MAAFFLHSLGAIRFESEVNRVSVDRRGTVGADRPGCRIGGLGGRPAVGKKLEGGPGSSPVLQPIMPLDLPVKVRSWELTVYPRSHIRRWLGVTRPAKARM